MSTQVDYQQFISALKKLIDNNTTSNLVLVTEDKHSLWVGLAEGTITSIIFGPKRGKAAIPFISRIHGGQLSMNTKTNLPPMPDLPPTEDILSQLVGSHSSIIDSAANTGFDAARANLIVAKLQGLLKKQLGPIANMIIPGIVRQVGSLASDAQIQQLIERMAKEVEGIGDPEKFRREANDIVSKL